MLPWQSIRKTTAGAPSKSRKLACPCPRCSAVIAPPFRSHRMTRKIPPDPWTTKPARALLEGKKSSLGEIVQSPFETGVPNIMLQEPAPPPNRTASVLSRIDVPDPVPQVVAKSQPAKCFKSVGPSG